MEAKQNQAIRHHDRRCFLVVIVAWSLFILALALLRLNSEWKNTSRIALVAAQDSFEKDILYRNWATYHGGVYVPVTEKTPPSPYLSHVENRDLQTESGLKLTLINPAYMTRQVHEMGKELYNHRGHITSLSPIRPENAPDPWEKKALEAFEAGRDEVSSVEILDSEEYLRFMRPLFVDKRCLKCHAEQGYQVGDIRGGISVSIPMKKHWAVTRLRSYIVLITFSFIWLLGVVGFVIALWEIGRRRREQAQAGRELAEKEAFLNRIIEQSPFPTFVADAKGTLERTNPALEKELNASKEQLVGRYNLLQDPLLEEQGLVGLVRTVFEQGKTIHFAIRWDGSKIDFLDLAESNVVDIEVTIFPIHNPAGELTHVVAHWIDISDRKRAEMALQKSEKRFRTLIQNSNDILVILDETAQERYVSDSVERITGFSPKECTEKTAFGFLHPEEKEKMKKVFQEILMHPEKPFLAEYRHQTKEGGWVDLEAIGTNWLHDPAVEGIVLNIRDITERKRTEKALRESEGHLQRIFELLPIGLWLADKEGKLVRGNATAVAIWGAEPRGGPADYGVFKARRLPSGQAIAPEDWALVRTIQDGATILNELLEIDAFDGQKRIILNSTAPVLDDEGAILGAIVLNQDITEQKKAEEENKALQKQVLQAQKMESIGRLAGGVAHDFNNMLGVILGHADMLLESTSPEDPMQEDLQSIVKAAKRSAELTGQLLAFARKQTIAPRILGINEMVSGTLKMLSRLIGENVELIWKPGEEDGTVKMDPAQIDQILTNLTVNARDAISDVGSITIETGMREFDEEFCEQHSGYSPGQYAQLTVSDTGHGMDKETLANIFEPFFTTKALGEGTGLGLATVYGIVKQNAGVITVYSEVGQGTTFHVYLPHFSGDKDQIPSTRRRLQAKTGSETILLVEDEAPLLKLAKRLLERLGYRVLEANSPEEALQWEQNFTGSIDLLVTDVIMPGMSGRSLWEKLHPLRPQLKCLFISGYTADAIAHRGILEDDVNFLQKPFTVHSLSEKVRTVLDD